jgi:NAD+ diphosphatase
MTTPLTVHLPFNRDILGATFAPAKRGGKPPSERGQWLLVQGQTLLVVADGGGFRLPSGDCPVPVEAAPFWLGTYHNEPLWVVPVAPDAPVPQGLTRETLVPMRGARLPDELLSLGGMAMQALWWESTSGHCPRCGTPTERIENEWGKRCGQCRYEHYPHLHPATIVLVRDRDRVLLTRKAEWAAGRYALIAGFVDNGESLEGCVAREIKEEVGVDVKDIRYVGSQNWPFPSQMMIGFVATYAGGDVVIDREELEDARWFPCDALPALPSRHSISRFIIDHYGHGGREMAPRPPTPGAPEQSPGPPR